MAWRSSPLASTAAAPCSPAPESPVLPAELVRRDLVKANSLWSSKKRAAARRTSPPVSCLCAALRTEAEQVELVLGDLVALFFSHRLGSLAECPFQLR
jgi:hypothetical protein